MMAANFLSDLEEAAPSPWLKPRLGCLPLAGETTKFFFKCGEQLLCFGVVGETLIVCCTENEWMVVKEYDLSNGTEVSCDRIMKISKSFDLTLQNFVVSKNCQTIVVHLQTWEGEFAVIERITNSDNIHGEIVDQEPTEHSELSQSNKSGPKNYIRSGLQRLRRDWKPDSFWIVWQYSTNLGTSKRKMGNARVAGTCEMCSLRVRKQ